MRIFLDTTHLSHILETSEKKPVIIFKYSNSCGSSEILKNKILAKIEAGKLLSPIFLVTVQEKRNLSDKISEWFDIKHESPQIIIVDKGKVTYTGHHGAIDLDKML